MRTNRRYSATTGDTSTGSFTVTTEVPEYLPPDVVRLAGDIALGSYPGPNSQALKGRYVDAYWTRSSDGVVFPLKMRLFQMPAGASTVVIGTKTYNADGTVTYTPTTEGYFITEAGVLVANTDTNGLIAGLLLADYFYAEEDDVNQHENNRVVELAAGDLFWVIVQTSDDVDFGWQVAASGAVTSGRKLIGSSATAGKLEMSGAISTASVAALNASYAQNLYQSDFYTVATALETIGAAGLCKAKVNILTKVLS